MKKPQICVSKNTPNLYEYSHPQIKYNKKISEFQNQMWAPIHQNVSKKKDS